MHEKTLGETLLEISQVLKKSLSPRFRVEMGRDLWPGVLGDVPDVVVTSPSGKRYFIELKGVSPEEVLPFATLSGLIKMKKSFGSGKDLEIFLTTAAQIPPLQEKFLKDINVKVIKTVKSLDAEPALKEIFGEIVRAIEKEYEGKKTENPA